MKKETDVIGNAISRIDGVLKVTGIRQLPVTPDKLI